MPISASTATPTTSVLLNGCASIDKRKSSRNSKKVSGAFRKHVITWSNIDTPEDPPPTANGPPTFADSGMQTEEDNAFDETLTPLITSMVSGAILNAMRSLLNEEEFGMTAQREKKLKEIIDKQNVKNTELNNVVELQLELQKELEEQKKTALRQLQALESRSLAADALSGMDRKSLEELISRKMLQVECGHRSVAADTQHLERSIARTKRAAAEIRADFFPYVYARAERIFVERLAGSYLKDALFARNGKRRDDAQALLNAQIFKYNQLAGRSGAK